MTERDPLRPYFKAALDKAAPQILKQVKDAFSAAADDRAAGHAATDIVAFLTARLVEDERWAKWAQTVIAGTWDCWEVVVQQAWSLCDTVPNIGRIGSHLQYNADPARVLRDVAAKRAILREHEPSKGPDPVCGHCVLHRTSGACKPAPYPCLTLRALTVPYDEHPDYDPTWRVQ